MQCRQAKEKISAYMDHELDAASSRQVDSHLQGCAECREALKEFQEIDGMVRGMPRFDLPPDFARQMIMKLSDPAATGEIERPGRLSLFERLFRLLEDFLDMVTPTRSPTTGTLDEFSDFPPLSMGHIYFKLMDLTVRG
jgi:anti-sigma factor RsiW